MRELNKKPAPPYLHEIELVSVDQLHAASYNPNRMTAPEYAALKQSILEFGYLQLLVVNRRTGKRWAGKLRGHAVVVGGHQRLRALKEMGWTEVGVNYVDLPPDRERALNLALNNSGSHDPLALGHILREFGNGSALLAVAGLSDKEVDGAMAAVEREALMAAGYTDDPRTINLPKNPKTKRGDLISLGRHRLLCGDATAPKDVEQLLGHDPARRLRVIDMMLSDPPYGSNTDNDWSKIQMADRSGSMKNTRRQYAQTIGDDKPFDPAHLFQLYGKVREVILFGADYYAHRLPVGGSWMVWEKWSAQSERPLGSEFELVWSRRKHKRVILRYPWNAYGQCVDRKELRARTHPNQKPVSLMQHLISRHGKRGQVVVDPYCGSGTVLLACERSGRTCLAMEIDPAYCDVIRDRYAQLCAALRKAV